MVNSIDLFKRLGLDKIENRFSIEDYQEIELNNYENEYYDNLLILKDEFDDSFILDVFIVYSSVFIRNDFKEMIYSIKECFHSDLWVTYIQYEWNTKGESSIFELMDSLKVGYFEKNLKDTCDKVRNLWINDYGDFE